MLIVLILLCAFYSAVTLRKHKATGAEGALSLAERVRNEVPAGGSVFVAAGTTPEDKAFADTLTRTLTQAGYGVHASQGPPGQARKALAELPDPPAAIACSPSTASWSIFDTHPDTPRLYPRERLWPDFLKRDNLINIANQIAVIAILAIGMTLIIITRGIDLSAGSLLALSAVATAWFIEQNGAESASAATMMLASLGGIAICAAMGFFNGAMVSAFALPPFIVTLSTMLIASGIAFDWADNESIHRLPESFNWLGRAAFRLPGIGLRLPVAVALMALLYGLAHFFMMRTVPGRYLYALGGGPEAARLSGVPVAKVLILAYTAGGAFAGLGGVLMASQLESGAPTYGLMYELKVIAAVVVGGASLSGGSGKIFGTLIGAFIIGVNENGMNLIGIEFGAQKYVLGAIILAAVLLDRAKRWWLTRLRQ
ncbi:MAG: ABC transporter permease [Verrucomicrobiae bacterium]|nr:ABC transporter permease [Verrucomicrobiae bacterium]MCP5542028.1 ABC transporter permease [Akkermansiaceae bacterium]MCP5551864.1 ABC transporter permease [Akkermansiaceae bacterium]